MLRLVWEGTRGPWGGIPAFCVQRATLFLPSFAGPALVHLISSHFVSHFKPFAGLGPLPTPPLSPPTSSFLLPLRKGQKRWCQLLVSLEWPVNTCLLLDSHLSPLGCGLGGLLISAHLDLVARPPWTPPSWRPHYNEQVTALCEQGQQDFHSILVWSRRDFNDKGLIYLIF